MIEATIEKLIAMKLSGMAEGLQEQISNHAYKDLSFEERLAIHLDGADAFGRHQAVRRLLGAVGAGGRKDVGVVELSVAHGC